MKNLINFLLLFFIFDFTICCVQDKKSNERLKETYYIGLKYLDNGDAPLALDYFQQCLNISKESDFNDMIQLSKVYSQMSEIYHQQKLPSYELEALNNAIKCAIEGGDSILALRYEDLLIMPYELWSNEDSIISITERVSKKYYDYGLDTIGNIKQENALYGYIENMQFDKAKCCIEIYEKGSGLFDHNGDIANGHEIYYYVKGLYYLGIDNPDSAEICFRKLMRHKDDINNREAAYRGLLLLYRKLDDIDSIGKYSQLYCETNDTAMMKSKSEEISRMHSLYNYNYHRMEAEKLAITVKKQSMEMLFFFSFVFFLCIIIFLLAYQHRKTNRMKIRNLESLYIEKLQHIDSLSLDKREQEKIINSLKHEAELLKEKISRENHEIVLEESVEFKSLLSRFHEAAKNPIKGFELVCPSDWQGLFYQSERYEHKFLAFVHQKDLSKQEFRVALLMRLKFVDPEIMALLNSYGSSYSNCKTRINAKLFKIESAKGLRTNIIMWRK